MPQQRNIALDLIRILACLMVVAMHSPIPSADAQGIFLSTISYITAPCIGLFFMISGALLLPTTLSASQFLKKRLSKLIPPTIIWTFIYLILKYCTESMSVSSSDFLINILSIPFSAQGHGVLWFMYTLIGFYLIIPIISPWLIRCSQKELIFYIFLCLLTFLYPFLNNLNIDKSTTSILYYFTGYGGYFLIGYYLNLYPESIKTWWTVIGFILAISIPIIVKLSYITVDFYEMFWYLSLPTMAMCVFWYKLITTATTTFNSTIGIKTKTFISNLSNLSFGIYLSHIAIMRFIIWDIPIIKGMNNYYLQTLFVFILTFSLSYIFSLIVCKTTIGKYIIGYSK